MLRNNDDDRPGTDLKVILEGAWFIRCNVSFTTVIHFQIMAMKMLMAMERTTTMVLVPRLNIRLVQSRLCQLYIITV